PLVYHNEAVSNVFDLVEVGDDHGDLIPLFYLKLVNAVSRRHRGHVNPYFIAITDNLVIGLQGNAIFFRHGNGAGKEGVIPLPDFPGTNLVTAGHGAVMRFSEGRAIVYQFHFITGNVDQLIVFRVQRANLQEAVFGEFAQRYQPLTIGFTGFTQRCMDVTRLILHVQFLLDVINILTVIGTYRIGHIPLHHLAVNEQGGVGVAATIEGGVQRTKAQFWFGDDGVTRVFDLAGKQVEQSGDFDHGFGR